LKSPTLYTNNHLFFIFFYIIFTYQRWGHPKKEKEEVFYGQLFGHCKRRCGIFALRYCYCICAGTSRHIHAQGMGKGPGTGYGEKIHEKGHDQQLRGINSAKLTDPDHPVTVNAFPWALFPMAAS
jgi:hypothetical protein